MPTFIYTARTKKGEKIEGKLDAVDRRSALMAVERLGHIPVSVEDKTAVAAKAASAKPHFTFRRAQAKMGMRDTLIFTTELSDLLAAGMPLGNALNSLANRKTGGVADEIIAQLRDEIIHGANLSDAMATQPATFSKLYVSMIRAGEASGAVHEVLRRLIEHFERLQEVKEKVVMALVYPMIVIFLGILTLIFSMVYVIPKFKIVFEQMGAALPLPTRILIFGSAWGGEIRLGRCDCSRHRGCSYPTLGTDSSRAALVGQASAPDSDDTRDCGLQYLCQFCQDPKYASLQRRPCASGSRHRGTDGGQCRDFKRNSQCPGEGD